MPCSILLVENSPVMQHFLERVVATIDMPDVICLAAENSQAAACMLENRAVDLIVLDTNTFEPGENLIQRFGRNPKLQRVPWIVISADATAMRIQNVLDLGATAYLPKPFAPGPLRREIARSLEAAHACN